MRSRLTELMTVSSSLVLHIHHTLGSFSLPCAGPHAQEAGKGVMIPAKGVMIPHNSGDLQGIFKVCTGKCAYMYVFARCVTASCGGQTGRSGPLKLES